MLLPRGAVGWSHARIQDFFLSGEVLARLPESSSDVVFFCFCFFSPRLNLQLYNGYFKENYYFPTFQRGSNFSGGGGGGGIRMLISVEAHKNLFFFSRGVWTPYPPPPPSGYAHVIVAFPGHTLTFWFY